MGCLEGAAKLVAAGSVIGGNKSGLRADILQSRCDVNRALLVIGLGIVALAVALVVGTRLSNEASA